MATKSWLASYTRPALSRRRFLGASAAGGLSAFILACGGGSDSPSSDSSGLLTKPADTSKQAKRGGTLKRSTNSDPAGLDPHGGGASVAGFYEIAYSRLFNY